MSRTPGRTHGPARRWTAAVLWMALIFRLSAMPDVGVPGRLGQWAHFLIYFVLGVLLARAMDLSASRRVAVLLAIGLASAYGVTDEIHQAFVPGRVPDPADWALDTAGAAVGAFLFASLSVRLARRGRPPGVHS